MRSHSIRTTLSCFHMYEVACLGGDLVGLTTMLQTLCAVQEWVKGGHSGAHQWHKGEERRVSHHEVLKVM